MLPHAEDFFDGTEWTYQQDGASIHTAHIVQDWFETHDIDVLPWPAHSPDLNPIENFWSMVDEELSQGAAPEDQEALRLRVADILTRSLERHSDYFRALFDSMSTRLQVVVESGGLPTNY